MSADSAVSTPGDVTLTLETLQAASEPIVRPLLSHLIRTETLLGWCTYVVDSAVQQSFPWQEPDLAHLCWWHQIPDELAMRHWLESGYRQLNLGWHMAVASSYYSAAGTWFGQELETLYVGQRHRYERAHCLVIHCGNDRGLALEISIALEAAANQEAYLQSLPQAASISRETISLADISAGIPQMLAGSPAGDWLPPFHNGQEWILLQLERIERPSLQELSPRLLRETIQTWRQNQAKQLASHWLASLTTSEPHA
jgi:hypothetical protein